MEVDAAGNNDLLAATGSADIGGGQVSVLAENGDYSPQTRYTILTADGGVSGAFDSVTTDLAFLDPTLSYSADAVMLLLERNDLAFAAIGTSPNQQAVGAAIEADLSGPLVDVIFGLNTEGAQFAFDQLSGEIHANTISLANREVHQSRDIAIDRLRVNPQGFGIWGHLGLSDTEVSAQDGFYEVESTNFTFGGGLEYGTDTTTFGIGFLRSQQDIDMTALQSDGDISSNHYMAYLGSAFGPLRVRAGASVTDHEIETQRRVLFSGFGDTLDSMGDGDTLAAWGELAFAFGGDVSPFEIFAGVSHTATDFEFVQESGGAAALTLPETTFTTTLGTIGARWQGDIGKLGRDDLQLFAEAAYQRYFDESRGLRPVSFTATGQDYTVLANDFGDDNFVGSLGIAVPLGDGQVGVHGDIELGESTRYGVRVSMGWEF